ncbi:MAG: efflux RND transporter permease subunit, partial [Deltaproteobacteria bacterium]
MLGRIIEGSIRNKFLVILATVFLTAWGIWAMYRIPLDAIPDLSDVQVIVFTEYPGQGPRIVEDQVTYPLTTAMLAVPKAKAVRGYSFFGLSFVYIIFDDGTDMYWARSRVLEYLNYVSKRLPAGVTPTLGPDATGVGWVYEYALVDRTGKHDLAQLRSLQDWFLRYELTAVDGVSEVASIGGLVKQYQVVVHPDKLSAYGIPIQKVRMAIQRSNNDVGGRLVEMGETEFMVRGLGYIKSLEDLRSIPLSSDRGTPVLLRDVADVRLGPELRRGIADLDGQGDVAGGVVIMRFGENALDTIHNVKRKLEDLKAGLPEGVEIVPVYDRSGLIERAIETLKGKLLEESLVVALVCIIFLLHFRSALVAILTLPIAVLMAFIVMYYQGLNANIMSLSGIAIAIGAMVDAAIIMIENMHKHMEHDGGKRNHWDLVIDASKEVGPTLFYSLLVITVSFLPVFTLEAQEGRLFKPLAFTKTYSMAAAALLSITIVPIWMGFFIRGKIRPETKNPINRFLIRVYHPMLEWALKYKKTVLIGSVAIILVTIWPLMRIGSEFMPPLYEGDLLYMPTTLPGISITKAKELLQQTDRIIRTFPEVERVFGKIGRAETATDPAPLSMLETTITLKPEKEWRK